MTRQIVDQVRKILNYDGNEDHILFQVVQHEHLALALLNEKSQIAFFNTGAENLTGYDAEEVLGKNIDTFFLDKKSIATNLANVSKTGSLFTPNTRLFHKKGYEVPINVSVFRLMDSQKNLLGYVAIANDLSEVKKAELDALSARDFYERILNDLQDAVVAVDESGKINFTNEAMHELLGKDADAFRNAHWDDIFSSIEFEESTDKSFAELILENKSVEGKAGFTLENGTSLVAAINASAVFNRHGKMQGWVASLVDITTEEEILRTESLTNHFLAISSDLGRYISEGLPLHTMLEKILGSILLQMDVEAGYIYLVDRDRTSATLQVQRNLAEGFLHAVQTLNLELNFVQCLIEKHSPTLLTECLDPDLKLTKLLNKYEYQYTLSTPLFHKESLVGFLNLVPRTPFSEIEVSLVESLATQLALAVGNALLVRDHRESQRKYSTVVERANDGIMISQDGVFKFCNKQFADMLGFTVSELTGLKITKTMDPDQETKLLHHYESRISGRIPQEIYQARLVRKDGSLIEVEFNACTIQYEGAPASLSFVRDISNRIALQAQVLEQKEMAEFYNDVLTHDINNFCQTMLGNLDTLQSELPIDLDAVHHDRLNTCKNSIKKISTIIDRVRELMHIQTITPDSLLPLNLHDVIAEGIEIAHETFPKADVRIKSSIPKNAQILGNNLVVLVFLNLLTNAIKHNDKDRIKIQIGIESTTLHFRESWKIIIADNGPGIDPEHRSKIFQRFRRFSKRQGKGLGLSIVRALVDKHFGSIIIADDDPYGLGGATIAVSFPKA